jgi:hypothetical protein
MSETSDSKTFEDYPITVTPCDCTWDRCKALYHIQKDCVRFIAQNGKVMVRSCKICGTETWHQLRDDNWICLFCERLGVPAKITEDDTRFSTHRDEKP